MSTQTFETSFRSFHHGLVDPSMVRSMRQCKMPVDFGMFTFDGIQLTDVTNPMLEFLIFGDERLPIVAQKICRTTSVGYEPIKSQNYRICVSSIYYIKKPSVSRLCSLTVGLQTTFVL